MALANNPIKTDSLKGWKSGASASLNFSQLSLSNWSAGGQSAISATSLINYQLVYKDSINLWRNNVDVAFGIIRQGDESKLAKSDDRVEINSSYGWSAFKQWYYNMSLNLKSQVAEGYKSPTDTVLISDFLAPAYMTLSIGMSHNNENGKFNFELLPLSGKVTYVRNQDLADSGAFGLEAASYTESGELIEHADNIRSEFGGTLKFQYKNEIYENITLQSKATLFSNYKLKATSIDVDWQMLVLMKINKYLSANINTHLIYDEDIDIALDLDKDGTFESTGPRTQFKELFGLGISYSF